jgi:poly-beta-1,6-N-acetyl-D-glucosamine synthase
MNGSRYALITAARDEENFIRHPIESVLSQKILPRKWVIISDGSVDRTDDIVREFAAKHPFIEFLRRDDRNHPVDFASKVRALRTAYGRLRGIDYEYVGNLDADISLGEDYYEYVISRFRSNGKLGIAGGCVHEFDGERFRSRFLFTPRSVPGAVQMFRRECYEKIGGLVPVPCGGEDWIAETAARMHGWEVESFPDRKAYHHRGGAVARGVWRERWRQGEMDYAIGSHPLFEVVKCLGRAKEKPRLLGALVRMTGFACSSWRKAKRPVSPEFVEYLRREQINRLRSKLE